MLLRWTAEERKTLKSLLSDGKEMSVLQKALPNRTPDAIHRQAQKFNFGVETINGVKYMYEGKKTRNRKKKVIETEDTRTIVGEARVAVTTPVPTTLERSEQNLSNDIIADNASNINRSALRHLYDDIQKLLNDTKYSDIQSVTVTLKSTVLTVSKDIV